MWDFEVGQFLHVTLKQPEGKVLKGEYQGSNERECLLYVDQHTHRERQLFIPNSNIAHIDMAKASAKPMDLAPGAFLKSELFGLVGMEELKNKAY